MRPHCSLFILLEGGNKAASDVDADQARGGHRGHVIRHDPDRLLHPERHHQPHQAPRRRVRVENSGGVGTPLRLARRPATSRTACRRVPDAPMKVLPCQRLDSIGFRQGPCLSRSLSFSGLLIITCHVYEHALYDLDGEVFVFARSLDFNRCVAHRTKRQHREDAPAIRDALTDAKQNSRPQVLNPTHQSCRRPRMQSLAPGDNNLGCLHQSSAVAQLAGLTLQVLGCSTGMM